jgi:hypothetical protein
MKFGKYLLVLFMILVNFTFAQSAFAEPPKFTTNPDYLEVTQTLTELSQAQEAQIQAGGTISETTQKQIDELTFQKYALESGINWGQCRNETGKTLAVYGKRPKNKAINENGLYFLADGQTTKKKWDCDGFYLPNDATFAGLSPDGQAQTITGPVAVKILDGSQLVIKTNPETAVIEVNIPDVKVVKPGEINWLIPNVSQALIDTRILNAPSQKSGS